MSHRLRSRATLPILPCATINENNNTANTAAMHLLCQMTDSEEKEKESVGVITVGFDGVLSACTGSARGQKK